MHAEVHPAKYWAFISYSHRDEQWATWLHRSLEQYRVPRNLVGHATGHGPIPKRLVPIFRDRDELPSATDLGAIINEALRKSDCQIVICSPHSAQSRWVNEEIMAFKRLGREHRIFCIIVGGEPYASSDPHQSLKECFPVALRYKLAPDGTLSDEPTEPIAADARDGKDGKSNAKLKLIAGMLGVGFDSLRRRELQRRNRRLAIIAAAALAGMTVTSGLAAYALYARAAEERQRLRAEAQAETARQTTNFLVDLFRISDPGEARGNSVTAREMLDKGAQRIQVELAAQPGIQATLMDTLGTVYASLGLYRQARPLLESALARRQESADADPVAVTESLSHLADLLGLQAEYQSAEKSYRAAMELARKRPASTAADRLQSDAMVAKARAGLGYALYRLGRLPEAEAALHDALTMQRKLNTGPNPDVARVLQDLALVIDKRGKTTAAVPLMEESLAMQRQLRGESPHPALAEALSNMSMLRTHSGDTARSLQMLEEAIAMKRRLLGERHPEIAVSLNNLAMMLQNQGNSARAEAMFRESLDMSRELLGNAHPEVANTMNNLAFVLYEEGKTWEALSVKRDALRIYHQLFPGDHPDTAATLNTIGFWLTEQERYDEAAATLRESLAMRRRLLGWKHPNVGSSLAHLAALQVATGRYQDGLSTSQDAEMIFRAALPANNWRIALAQSIEGAALLGLHRTAEARPLLQSSYVALNRDPGALPMYRRLARRYADRLAPPAESSTPAKRGQRAIAAAPAAAR